MSHDPDEETPLFQPQQQQQQQGTTPSTCTFNVNNDNDDDDTWGLQTETTSDLLASSAWQIANPLSYDGLVHRLEMMREHGLPPMRVISAKTLEKLGRIPRSTDDFGIHSHTEDALDVVMKNGPDIIYNNPNAIILFFSHRWLRPNYCQEEDKDLIWGTDGRKDAMDKGYVVGYPDSSDNEKATALIHYARWFKNQCLEANTNENKVFANFGDSKDLELFLWIDFCCVDQTNPGPDMKALPAFAAVSAGILSYFSEGYDGRAWCRVELMLSHSFMMNGDQVLVLPQSFRYEDQEGIDHPPVAINFSVPDPMEGEITNEDDWAIVKTLQEVASKSTVFTCWRVYVNRSLQNAFWCFYWNICCCFMWCGLLPWSGSRSVRPGEGRVRKIIPKPYAP